MTVFLYEVKRRLDLTLVELDGSINWNLPMDTSDFRIYKNVTNHIEFHVRNPDRKSIDVTDKIITVTVYDQLSNKIVLEKLVDIINGEKGMIRLTFIPDEIEMWDIGSYSYVVRIRDEDGSERALFVDQNEGIRGFLRIDNGPYPPPRGAISINEEQFTGVLEGNPLQSNYYTSAIPGSIKNKNHTGLHTIVLHLDSFTGTVWVQGSLEEGTPSNNDWFEISIDGEPCTKFKRASGTYSLSFEANLEWFRVKFFKEVDDIPECDNNKITRIDFRN